MSKNHGQPQHAPIWASQNFLTSARTISILLGKTTITPEDHVIEIGPGKGHITGPLARRCRALTAVEIDTKLYGRLREKFSGMGNLNLVRQDFLCWPLPIRGAYKIFANIPFSHTTAILRKLTDCANPPMEAWLTMERGAALRFMGIPRETLGSLAVKPVFDIGVIHRFQREDFHPMPGVDVVLIHLTRKAIPDVSPGERRDYERFIARAMQAGADMRRAFPGAWLSRALREARADEVTPAETLYIQWLCLFRSYRAHVLCKR